MHKKSNDLCLATWEKPIVKCFNYHMIIQRQRVHSTDAQVSVLKMLLKFRDYMARFTDESVHYILPNHALF